MSLRKQILKRLSFEGGINNNSEDRDISDNELVSIVDMIVDEIGKMRMMGGQAAHGSITNKATDISAGYGLFFYSTDRLQGAAAAETGEDWIAFADHNQNNGIHLWGRVHGAWWSSQLALGTSSSSKIIFFAIDGILRVSDANFGVANRPKWRGYIERTHFDGLTPGGAADAYDDWYSKNNDLAKPTRGLFGLFITSYAIAPTSSTTNLTAFDATSFSGMDTQLDKGDYLIVADDPGVIAVAVTLRVDNRNLTTPTVGVPWNTLTEYNIFPPAGTGFSIQIALVNDPESSISGGDYELATSFVYDNNQESLLFDIAEEGGGDNALFTVTASDKITLKVQCASPFDPRITGGRIYIRGANSGDSWILFADIDLVKGGRVSLSNDNYSAWTNYTAGGGASDIFQYTEIDILAFNVDTYESINGYAPSEKSIDIGQVGDGYKAVVNINRKAYYMGVKRTGQDGTQVYEGDSIYPSMINRFDVVPVSKKLVVAKGDGESIVTGVGFSDRILEFKQRTLRIINAAQEFEYVEAKHSYRGVKIPAAVYVTDFGVAFVNSFGLFIYDGENIIELLVKEGKRLISETAWTAFVTDNTMLGYYPKKKQLIVLKSSTSGANYGDILLFDMITHSFVEGNSKYTDSEIKTNFVSDWNGDLVLEIDSGVGLCKVWDDSADASATLELIFKDEVYSTAINRKTVHSIWLTHKGAGVDKAELWYRKIDASGLSSYVSLGNLTNSTDWIQQEFAIGVDDVYSIQLKIVPVLVETVAQTIASTFTINGIHDVYVSKDVLG